MREESRKAEMLFLDWNIADIKRKEDIWRKNGGEIITLSPRRKRSATSIWSRRSPRRLCRPIPRVKDDYEALLAAAKKYRNSTTLPYS